MNDTQLLYRTTTMCPLCGVTLPGDVCRDERGVFIERRCEEHAVLRGLICSDISWYESLSRFDVPPSLPNAPRRERRLGCPHDCGLCNGHRQSAGTTAIEISNRCNSACPSCLASNVGTFELSAGEVRVILDRAVRDQGTLEVVTLSGGEPTIHPQFFQILDAVCRPEVGRVVVNSNGIRINHDDAFLERLATYSGVYISLHHDGPGAEALRGRSASMQRSALDRLCSRGIPSVPVVLAARGVNEEALGSIALELLSWSPAVKSIIVSLMAYTGSGGAGFPFDPMNRLTIPAALAAMEEGTGGALRKSDFIPLPMPNPLCAAVGYFLVDEDGALALLPAAGVDRVVHAIANVHFARPDDRLEGFFREAMERVFADPECVADASQTLKRLKRLVSRLFPRSGALSASARAHMAESSIKTVYLMQFMDPWTFDTRRLEKCSCQHLFADGVRIPSCGYYAFHRARDPRFQSPLDSGAPAQRQSPE